MTSEARVVLKHKPTAHSGARPPNSRESVIRAIQELREVEVVRGGDCCASQMTVAVIGMVDRSHIYINTLSIHRAVAQGPFWPARTDHRWVYPGAGTLMPLGLGNAAATYRRLQQTMLVPFLLGCGEEVEEMIGPSEGPQPRETADP